MADNELTDEQRDALAEAHEQAAAETGAEIIQHPSAGQVEARGGLTVNPDQDFWTARQLAALQTIGLEDVSKPHLAAFLHICQRSGLDPFTREVYYIGRRDDKVPGGVRYTAQTGIDGYRKIAERSRLYGGREGPWWCGPDGQWQDVWIGENPPVAARVAIYRKDFDRPVMGQALYREFVPMQPIWENRRKVGEKPGAMWAKMPAHMLAKCAEALAIRQAFPAEAGGIYTDDEMGVADQRAREAAEETRATQRRELVERPWGPGAAATPAETAPGDVVPGVVEPSRDDLWAELTEQAQVLDKTIAQHTTRWAATHKRNIEDATDEELAVFLEANRARVAEKRAVVVADAVDDVAEALILEPDLDVQAPHPYQDWDGKCLVCTEPKGDPRHDA